MTILESLSGVFSCTLMTIPVYFILLTYRAL
jgi:hypothetical protein